MSQPIYSHTSHGQQARLTSQSIYISGHQDSHDLACSTLCKRQYKMM
jgi:hypothetical protein